MTRTRRRLALGALAILSVSAVAAGATYGAFTSTTSNTANNFAAATSFCSSSVTPEYLTGFESGVISNVHTGLAGTGLFDEVWPEGGIPFADSSNARHGDYSLRINHDDKARSYVLRKLDGATGIERVAIRFATLPTVSLDRVLGMGVDTGNSLRLGYDVSSNKLEMHFQTGVKAPANTTVTAGDWIVIDMKVSVGTNPRTVDWRVNGVDQTRASLAEPGSDLASVFWGSVNPGDQFSVNYDDVLVSTTAADYPLGDGKVLALRPNASSSTTPSAFSNDDGTAVNASSYARLNDKPMGLTTNDVFQNAISATNHVDLGFEDTSETCFNGVSAVMAHHSASSAQATNAKTSILDGSTESVVHSGNMVSTAPAYHSAMVTPANKWTTATVNGLAASFGYWTSGTVPPRWDGLLLEYDARP